METRKAVEAHSLDTGTLSLFVGYALAEPVREAVVAQGHPGLRFSHGFVLQHLIEGDLAVSEVARRMGVSQQAASKAVGELVRMGYIALSADPSDARVRRAGLTAQAWDAVARGREARAAQEEALARRFGPTRLADARAVLAEILEEAGGTESVRGRQVRMPR